MAASIQRRPASWSPRLAIGLLVALVVFGPAQPAAHDIPNNVLVQAFIKPEGQRLRLFLRVPLTSMRDFSFPSRPGVLDAAMLDVASVAPMLEEATRLWLVPGGHASSKARRASIRRS